MRDVEALGREPMGKLLLRLSTPSVVGMLVQSLYNVVDAFFVGRSVGLQGIAAVFSAFPIQIVVMAFTSTNLKLDILTEAMGYAHLL